MIISYNYAKIKRFEKQNLLAVEFIYNSTRLTVEFYFKDFNFRVNFVKNVLNFK